MLESTTKAYAPRDGTVDFDESSKLHYRELHQYLVFYLARSMFLKLQCNNESNH